MTDELKNPTRNIPSWYLNYKQFEPYAFIENAFTDEECNQIKEYSNTLCLEKAKTGGYGGNDGVQNITRENEIAWINEFHETSEMLYGKLTNYINSANQQFWGFDLDYISVLQFTKYSSIGDKYDAHIDTHIGNSFNYRKLSFSLQLDDEDDYVGSDLLIHMGSLESEKIIANRKKGSLNLFPSFMLHQVSPLESGERNCIVGWVCGPNFK